VPDGAAGRLATTDSLPAGPRMCLTMGYRMVPDPEV